MINYITLRATAHATEEKSRVKKSLDLFLLNSLGNNTDTYQFVESLDVEGHYGNPITLYNSKLSRKYECNKLVMFIKENLSSSELATLCKEIPERLDEEQMFHLRFNKQEAYLGRVVLSSSSDAIIVKMKVATYPKNWGQARKNVEDLFG
ncbi:MAG: RNA-binding protein [Methanohalobium sp.]|uniref:RNA-binding protein n=1 Tax=Methanohalobium sp. TaxID=2837493 RepID=UPI00397CCC1A